MSPRTPESAQTPPNPQDRRAFLRQAAGRAAGAASLAQPAAAARPAAANTLPTVRLGKHPVSRLILGGNPIYGNTLPVRCGSRSSSMLLLRSNSRGSTRAMEREK